ncbi:hypothetical protein COT63_01505 [Candidatus Shapirobacteria bacterium CG09_land_8_20_14_0_10_38_17]|uniref:HIT domain-containing protein n=1 Tax=Candidatus Shapirobacteria bacterium CG09_land_8_20_14_0_10_38_17 TaxID=1974884 RepID=A0A2H0WR76_9BACT|nr:MAG: hypothetical protein COT63_01505 [Candidatus Shapirobacteria bacterium CG09_land_8_20_14_0_10_38_17]
MSSPCIFCQIVNGKIPAEKIYEDNNTLAFLDINPLCRGHVLVIPKKHYENIFDLPSKELINLIATAQKIAQMIKKNLGATGINLLHASGKDAQQSVFHFHIHVVPRYPNDGLNTWPSSRYQEKDLRKVKKALCQ